MERSSFYKKMNMLFIFSLFILVPSLNILAQTHDKSQASKTSFENTAQTLADNLKEKLNLTQDQVDDVKSTLIDYNKKIHEEKDDAKKEDRDKSLTDDTKLTGGAETRPELIKEYEKVDEDANKDIEKTLKKDQLLKYTKIKDSWWATVKKSVFSSKNNVDEDIENNNSNTVGSINKDRIDMNDNDTTGMEEKFHKNAKALSISLMKKVNLTLEQAAKVKDILVDYQKDVYDTRGKNVSDENDHQYNGTNTVVDNKNSDNKDNDRELTGGENKLTSELNRVDKKANDDIENVLNKEQLKKYLNYKNGWWKEIKDKVYSKETHKNRSLNNNSNE